MTAPSSPRAGEGENHAKPGSGRSGQACDPRSGKVIKEDLIKRWRCLVARAVAIPTRGRAALGPCGGMADRSIGAGSHVGALGRGRSCRAHRRRWAGTGRPGGGSPAGERRPGRHPGQRASTFPAISAGGRWVAFQPEADNLVTGDRIAMVGWTCSCATGWPGPPSASRRRRIRGHRFSRAKVVSQWQSWVQLALRVGEQIPRMVAIHACRQGSLLQAKIDSGK